MTKPTNTANPYYVSRKVQIGLLLSLAFLLGCTRPNTAKTDKAVGKAEEVEVKNQEVVDSSTQETNRGGLVDLVASLKETIRSDKNLSFVSYHQILTKDVSRLMDKYGSTINELIDLRHGALIQAIEKDAGIIYHESILEQQNILLELEQEKQKLFETFWLAGDNGQYISESQKSEIKINRGIAAANICRLVKLDILGNEEAKTRSTRLANLLPVKLAELEHETFQYSYCEYLDKLLLSYCNIDVGGKEGHLARTKNESQSSTVGRQLFESLLVNLDSRNYSDNQRASLISSIDLVVKEIKAERLDYVEFNKLNRKGQQSLRNEVSKNLSELISARKLAVEKLIQAVMSGSEDSKSSSWFRTNPHAFAQKIMSKERQLSVLTKAVVEYTLLNSRGPMLYSKNELRRRKSRLLSSISWLEVLSAESLPKTDRPFLASNYEVEMKVRDLKSLVSGSTKNTELVSFSSWMIEKQKREQKKQAEIAHVYRPPSERRKQLQFHTIEALKAAQRGDRGATLSHSQEILDLESRSSY